VPVDEIYVWVMLDYWFIGDFELIVHRIKRFVRTRFRVFVEDLVDKENHFQLGLTMLFVVQLLSKEEI
jgi:hypothetical protein